MIKKTALRSSASIIVGCLLCALSPFALAQVSSYQLKPGDILNISVWKEEALQLETLVLPDGMISFPLAGHLMAAGKTPREVQDKLAERIREFIPEPQITVTVKSTNGNKIYVVGQINKPGEFLVTHEITVMQALSLAGGLTAFGDENDIRILRRGANGRQQSIAFDYSAVKNGNKLDSNIRLESGDVVVVPD